MKAPTILEYVVRKTDALHSERFLGLSESWLWVKVFNWPLDY